MQRCFDRYTHLYNEHICGTAEHKRYMHKIVFLQEILNHVLSTVYGARRSDDTNSKLCCRKNIRTPNERIRIIGCKKNILRLIKIVKPINLKKFSNIQKNFVANDRNIKID